MPVDTAEIMNVLSAVAEEEQLKVTVKNCARGAIIGGLSAGVGGFFGGPIGMAIVGVCGVIVGAATSEKFLPVQKVIANMEPSKREILAEKVRCIMNNLDITDAMALTALIACNTDVKSKVLIALCSHLQTEMNQAIVNY